MSAWTYYHNPSCSKSRIGLSLLEESALQFEIKYYKKTGLSEKEVTQLIRNYQNNPLDLVRTNDAKKQKIPVQVNTIIKTLVKHPELLQRPILANQTTTIIGRPTENLHAYLNP